MGTSGPPPSITLADTLAVFHRSDEPGTPLTSTEIAEKLECTRRTAYGKLEELTEQGELKSKKTGARSRIWWRPTTATDAGERDSSQLATPEQFSAFVRAVQDYAIFTLDPDGTITSWNEGAEQIKGYEEDDILGEHISAFYTDDAIDRGMPEQNLEDAANRGHLEDEGWRVRKDGSQFWANVIITAVRDDDGTLQGFTKVTRNMTERREREQALAEAERHYRTLAEHFPDGAVALFDEDHRYTAAGGQLLDQLGISAEDAVGSSIYERYPDDLVAEIEPYFHAALNGEANSFETEYNDRHLKAYTLPVKNDGEIFSGMLVIQDITERKERERALEESERRYRTFAEHFPNGGVTLFDEDLRFTLVAGQAFDELGLSPENMEGQTPQDAYGDEVADAVESTYRAALDGEEESVEVEYADREWIVHTVPVFDERGEVFAGMAMAQDITERKEHERELERYKAVVEAVPDAVYMLDAAGHVQLVNEEMSQVLTEYTEEEVTGVHFSEFMDAEDVEKSRDAVGELLSSKTETEKAAYELTLHGANERVPCENHMAVLSSLDGEFQVVGVLRNIADRKARERELEQYKTAVDVASDVIVTIDERSTIQAVNPAVEDIFGYDPDELVGKPLTILMPEPLRERHREGIRRYLETGERNVDWTEIELPGQHEAGHEIPLAISFSGYEHDGERFFVGVIRDNAERKAYERELERRIRQQQVVTELGQRALENPDLDVLFDEAVDAVADTLNNAYCKVLDLLAGGDELLLRAGVGWKEGYVGEAAVGTGLDSQAGYTLQSETPIVVEDLHTEERFSGPPLLTEHDVVSGISTIIGPYHDPWGILGTHDTRRREFTENDVNFVQSVATILATAIEHKQFEKRISETVEKLEESNERLEQFAYVASHDLQEPLRMVSSYLQLLERRYADDLDDDAEEFIDFAVDGTERMQAMIEDLLDYSRLDTQGKEFEPTDCNTVLKQTLESLRLSIEETDAEITADTLPTVMGDPDQLGQLFQNLISNAIKYRGDEPPRIAIEVDRRDGEWQFSVTDNGIGIDPDQTDRIFQIFNRLHSTEEYSGTGIGLAMCQKIVEHHGGEIWVESEPGDGSTFSFTLPVAQTTGDDVVEGAR